jgi:carboxylesterase type B
MAECSHPLLGTVRGRRTDSVVQFLGIPYATIKQRLGPPIPIDSPRNGDVHVLDATSYGFARSTSDVRIQRR